MWSFTINFYVLVVGFKIVASTSKECQLPADPNHATLTPLNNLNSNATHAPHFTILQVTCQDNSSVVVCLAGQWTPPIGQCLSISISNSSEPSIKTNIEKCPTILSTSDREVTCKFDGKNLENCNDPPHSAVARVKCQELYEDTRLHKTDLVCENGKWSERLPKCEPTCGKAQHNGTNLEFPWMAVLYKSENKTNLCGATLISSKVVVTAAQCVTTQTGELNSASDYLVAVGKRYPELGHAQDKHFEQQSEVKEIFISKSLRGVANYHKADIAVLVTQNPFVFNTKVQPICIDWMGRVDQEIASNEKIQLYVSTWRYWMNGTRAPHFPISVYTGCQSIVHDNYFNNLGRDKFCASFESYDVTFKRGDGGVGAYIKLNEQFYFAGIVSHIPRDRPNIVLYTRISNYSDELILRNLVISKAEDSLEEKVPPVASWEIPDLISCQLPEHTKKGYWYIDETPNVKVIKYVTSISQIRLRCPQNYTVKGYDINYCKDGRWIYPFGKCDRQCPPLEGSEIKSVICKDKNKRVVDCKESGDYVIARFACKKTYVFDVLNQIPLVCLNGTWSENVPECVKSN